MAQAIAYRGPDGADVWSDVECGVALAHQRLAIIDLSPAGHQPMRNAEAGLSIVFNGEIYNFADLRSELQSRGHVFRSQSDTEVILAAYGEWGEDCLSRFNGMFAFAIHDERRRRLFLARDRVGEKPLFVALTNGTLRFASELKALFTDPAFPRRIDPEALDCYLTMGFVPGERCILRGVNKLAPAHALLFDLESASVRVFRYWQLPDPPAAAAGADAETLLDELEALLADAVRRQLVADVPVGILLSGGVDSSLVTALAVRAASDVRTFTIRFPGSGRYDETEHARLIAHRFGTKHQELEAEAGSSVDLLPMLARQFDEPIVDSSMIPTYLVSRLVRGHCTVALGGDGGDELFGGYEHYSRLLWVQQRLGAVPLALRRAVAQAATLALPVGFKGRNWLQGLSVDFNAGVPLVATVFDRRVRRALVANEAAESAERIRQERMPQTSDLLERATRMDFENYMPEDILVKVDRASMLNSLEVRAPLLDYRIVEFAFGKVPPRLKATTGTRKVLLKMLTTRLLPPEFDRHRKQGFSIPLAAWLTTTQWREFFHDVLLNPGQLLFSHKTVRGLLEGQARGRANTERLFSLVMFELWRREYDISLP